MGKNWKVDRWGLVGLSMLVIGASLFYVAVRHGWGDEGLRGAIRVTARSSLFLFLFAFSASSLKTFLPSDGTRWLLANRRFFGIAFALSHLIHGAAIITLATLTGGGSLTARVVGLGSAGVLYGFILFMLATSFDRTAAWVGPRWWKIVHTLGSYLVYLTFLATYARKATDSPAFLPHTLLLLAVLGLRIARRARGRRGDVMGAKSASP
ncbi:MAG: hypothetical protein K0U98_12910 [Deltaproteobacteria bacterium]|nr:hypothetical protein [Deltaproteobacteria bacterium]